MGSFYRTRGYRFNWSGFITPGVKVIVMACSGVFLVQTLTFLLFGGAAYLWLDRHFGLVPIAVTQGLHIWQPFTYIFLHGGIWHLLINMLMLWMFGRDLEQIWGKRRFYQYFFLCGIRAGLINWIVKTIPIFSRSAPPPPPPLLPSAALFPRPFP